MLISACDFAFSISYFEVVVSTLSNLEIITKHIKRKAKSNIFLNTFII
nr:MAG TPA: hypothetical protein [Caudoviricetes sp.]